MFSAFFNIFKVPDLRNKVLFTLGLLAVYRIGFYVPIPGVDQTRLSQHMTQTTSGGEGGLDQLTEYFSMFTGGNLRQSTIFGLGIMPYISASIIFQLLGTVVPSLEKLRQEGEMGRKKIQEYTRYATVAICLVQAAFWLSFMRSNQLVYSEFSDFGGNFWPALSFWLVGITGMTAGTMFLMWLGEQIDEYGIGNGVSLIIMAGIVARMPQALIWVFQNASMDVGAEDAMGPAKIVFLIVAFVAVVAGSILITQGQRRIPIQQAKQMRGRRMYGGERNYLPLRVNHGGVMPIIFASSLLIFPSILFSWLANFFPTSMVLNMLAAEFGSSSFLYVLCYIGMVYFFAYFWTTVQFQPKEMATSLRDNGSFIPGLRPGKRTADYLETVMTRITYVGAGFLAVIAIIPQVIASAMGIPISVSSFLGGTGLLIVVSVGLDLVQRIEASLVMRNYGGFLESERGGRIKGGHM
ncbi:MAG: preprotein translocase subunit SecY [Phycisphaerae bacterium]